MDNVSLSPPSSVNSFPVSHDNEDIYSKYQRLASQYAQVRAQVIVLKKGILDEREKSSYNKDAEVGKSQKLRSLQQEVDGLTFRNGQLTKRVSVLQEELDIMAKRKNKNNKGPQNNITSKDIASIHIEELESKIKENEMLHSKIQSIENDYKARLSEAYEQINSLQRSSTENNTLLTVSKSDYEDRISVEEKKSVTLQVHVDKLTKTLTETKAMLDNKNSIQSMEVKKTSAAKKRKNYDSLNLLAKDKKRLLLIEQTISTMQGYVSDYSHSLLNYCTYLEQRIKIHSDEVGELLTPTNEKLCSLLLENAVVIRPLDAAYSNFVNIAKSSNNNLNSCSGLKDLSATHSIITEYMVKVFTLLQKSVSEENTLMSCSVEMEKCNNALCETFEPLCNALINTNTCLNNVSHVEDTTTAKLYVPALISSFKDLSMALKCTLSATHPKLLLCHKLAMVTQRLKTTDECAIGSLQMYLTTLNKMSAHLEGCGTILVCSSRFGSDSVSPYSQDLTVKCQEFLKTVNRTTCSTPSTPSPDHSSSESTDLAQELSVSKERVHKLEQDKEHWMLEAQLHTIKLEKLQKRVDSAEKEARNPSPNTDLNTVDNLLDLSSTGSTVQSLSPWDDSGLREDAIRNHFLNRIQILTLAMQKSEGCSMMYKRECKNIKTRLLVAEKEHNQIAIEIGNSDNKRHLLEEELNLTKDKYDGQIALMSEHLCGMNDKLVQLNEENQHLRGRK